MDKTGGLDIAYSYNTFVILMVLLYIPPVQNLLRREVTAYASKATGMQIQVERIDLRFRLICWYEGWKSYSSRIPYCLWKA